MTGVPPQAGSGSRASHEAAKASSPKASIPNAAFTPGPWWAAGFSSIVGVPVCAQPDKTKNTFNVCGVAAPVSREENIANANLIAAAPELYEALRQLASNAEIAKAHLPAEASIISSALFDTLSQAESVLAKARGQ